MDDERVQFHQIMYGRVWWRPISELVLAIIWWFVAGAVVGAFILGASHAKKFNELDEPSHLATTLLMLAIMIPAGLAAVRVIGRRPGTVLSVEGRLRWRWLARCAIAAIAIDIAISALPVVLRLRSHGLGASGTELLWIALLVVALVPFQAAAEELFFRGVLMQVIGAYLRSPWIPIVVSSVLFVLAHGAPLHASVAIAAMATSFAWLTIRTGGLEAGIALHAVSNITAFMSVAATRGLGHVSPIKMNEHISWLGVGMTVAEIGIYTLSIDRMWKRFDKRESAGRSS